ncbi:hypothetical protein F5Y19DRAFT_429595 [Xylariaceae sp. FL1651]|nr:hypothetical protein F5Y19DRAFT_429595 [Xylariaceae sp. FL1651]
MRQNHFRQAHRNVSSKLSFDTQNLDQNATDVTLYKLVQEGQVEAVQKLLSAFPNALQLGDIRNRLQIVAAFHASGSMCRLLEHPDGHDVKTWQNFLLESIKGHNESTLRYRLSWVDPVFQVIGGSDSHKREKRGRIAHSGQCLLIAQLVSDDWNDGIKIIAMWLRNGLQFMSEAGSEYNVFANLRSGKRILRAAASHPAGNQQLLHLWRDFGAAKLGRRWASQTLIWVAKFNFSITLAAYLLEVGANINEGVSTSQKTALHHAACNTSAKAAEMARFLLLNGADPNADPAPRGVENGLGKKISEEKGAKGIHRWLGQTWDELVEETKQIRDGKEAARVLISRIGEE